MSKPMTGLEIKTATARLIADRQAVKSKRHTVGKILASKTSGGGYGLFIPGSYYGVLDNTAPGVNAEANAQRLADCWNACVDMENPAEEIANLKAKVAKLSETITDIRLGVRI